MCEFCVCLVFVFFGGEGVLFVIPAACVLQLYSLQDLRWFMFPVLGRSVGGTSGSPCRHFTYQSCKHTPF